MRKGYKDIKNRLLNIISKPEMRILPGQLAFFLLLSLIPLIAVIAVMANRLNLPIQDILNSINNNLPSDVAEFIIDIINGRNVDINIIIFCISAFILASNGPQSMITGSNMLYKIKDKDIISTRIKAIIMTVFLVILLLFVLTVPVFGDQIVKTLVDILPDNQTVDNIIKISYSILKYPLSLFIIFFLIKLLYTMAPDRKIKSKYTTNGALLTTIGWVLFTELYAFYITKIAFYNVLYGSVAQLIVLFIWIYILAYIFVLGMALNASIMEEEKE